MTDFEDYIPALIKYQLQSICADKQTASAFIFQVQLIKVSKFILNNKGFFPFVLIRHC